MVISLSLGISIAVVLMMWVVFLVLVIFVKAVRAMAIIGSICLLGLSIAVFWLIRFVGVGS